MICDQISQVTGMRNTHHNYHDHEAGHLSSHTTDLGWQPHTASNASPTSYHESPTAPGGSGTSPAQDSSALLTVIGGDAYAAGMNTDASGTVNNTVKDLGNITVASGYAIFEATASSPAGDAAAGANTFVSVAGADFVLTFDFDVSFKVGNTVVAASETAYLAIDVENWSSPNGPLVMDFQAHASGHGGQNDAHLPGLFLPSGNFAQVAAVANALGPDTATSTLTQALTIENHFSYVNGMAIAAA
jgi:hypothetical protein